MTEAQIDSFVAQLLQQSSGTAEQLLDAICQHFSITDMNHLNPVNMPNWRQHTMRQARVVARVVSACLTRPIVTLTDLEREICESERVSSFADLLLGESLQCLPIAQRYFSIAPSSSWRQQQQQRAVRPTTSDEVMSFFLKNGSGLRLLFDNSSSHDEADCVSSSFDLVDGFARSVGLRHGYECGIHVHDMQQFRMLLQTEAARFPSSAISLLGSFAAVSRRIVSEVPTQQRQQQQVAAQQQQESRIIVAPRKVQSSSSAVGEVISLSSSSSLPSSLPISGGFTISGLFPTAATSAPARSIQEHQQQQILKPAASTKNKRQQHLWNPRPWLSLVLFRHSEKEIENLGKRITAAACCELEGGADESGGVVGWRQWNQYCSAANVVASAVSCDELDGAIFESFLIWFAAVRLDNVERNIDAVIEGRLRQRNLPQRKKKYVAPSAHEVIPPMSVAAFDDDLSSPNFVPINDPSQKSDRRLILDQDRATAGPILFCFSDIQWRKFLRRFFSSSSTAPPVLVFNVTSCLTKTVEQNLGEPFSDDSQLHFLPLSSCYRTNITTGAFDAALSFKLTESLSLSLRALRLVLLLALEKQQDDSDGTSKKFFDAVDDVMQRLISPHLQVVAVSSLQVSYTLVEQAATLLSSATTTVTALDSENCFFSTSSRTLFVAAPSAADVNNSRDVNTLQRAIRGNVVADTLADGLLDVLRCASGIDCPEDPRATLRNIQLLSELRVTMIQHFTWSLFLTPEQINFECRSRGVIADDDESTNSGANSNKLMLWSLTNGLVPASGKLKEHYPITASGNGIPLIPGLERRLVSSTRGVFNGSNGDGSFAYRRQREEEDIVTNDNEVEDASTSAGRNNNNDDNDDDDSNPFLRQINASLSNPLQLTRAFARSNNKNGAAQRQQPQQHHQQLSAQHALAGGAKQLEQEMLLQSRAAEMVVFERLKEKQEQQENKQKVEWVNQRSESGLPYDVRCGDDYYEVKSTSSGANARSFDCNLSVREFAFANQHKNNYHVAMVWELGPLIEVLRTNSGSGNGNNASSLRDALAQAKVKVVRCVVQEWERGNVLIEGNLSMMVSAASAGSQQQRVVERM